MEKLVVKGKKEIRMMLADSLHETIKTVGLTKSVKKLEKALEKSSRKLAAKVAQQMKKELKKMRRATGVSWPWSLAAQSVLPSAKFRTRHSAAMSGVNKQAS